VAKKERAKMKARISFKLWLVIWIFLFLGLAAGKTYGKYGGGTGTENDPYLIYTAGQMNTIGLHYEDWDKHFKLMEDIDLAGISYNIIGDRIHLTGVYYFTGVFDGNNHKIINFHLSSDYPSGLFGVVGEEGGDKGEIKNVTLINPHVNVQNGFRICWSRRARWNNGIWDNDKMLCNV